MKKKRVAICMSGGMRCYRQTAPSLFRNLIFCNPDCDFDLFIYTTDIIQDGAFRYSSQDDVLNRLRELYGSFARYADHPLNIVDVSSTYNGLMRNIYVENPQAYSYSQIISMYWKVKQCDRMRRLYAHAHGFEYDLVIRTRSDVMIVSPMILSPYFDHEGVMFQSWLFIPPAFVDFALFMRLMASNVVKAREIISDFTMGGKFSDILFWSSPSSMAVVDKIFDTFLMVANKLQREHGNQLFLPFEEPEKNFTWPISLDGLTNIAIHAHGVQPVLAKKFRMFLVMHFILQKEDGTILFDDVPEIYKRKLLQSYFRNEHFEPPCSF